MHLGDKNPSHPAPDETRKNLPSLEQIALEVVLLSPNDTEACNKIQQMFQYLSETASLSSQLRALASEAVKVMDILKQNPDASDTLKQLSTLLDRMQTAESEPTPATAANGTTAPSKEVVDDGLVHEFLMNQDSVLQEFEAACLTLDTGDRTQTKAILRQLHTWKGESGILGFYDLATFMHNVEDALHDAANIHAKVLSDALFAVKDQLVAYFNAKIKNTNVPPLDLEAITSILNAPIPEDVNIVASMPDPEPIPEPVPAPEPEPPVAVIEPTHAAEAERKVFAMPEELDMELVSEFLTESAEHFQNSEVALMNLESNPSDTESINIVFRAFHTVKGVSSFVGVAYITEFAHKAETFLDRIRKGQLILQGALTDLAFESLDMLKNLLKALPAAIEAGQMETPPTYYRLLHRLENPELEQSSAKTAAEAKTVPVEDKLGEILIREGVAEPQAVEHALEIQQTGDPRPLGEILVQEESVKAVDVAHAIRSQQAPTATKSAEAEGSVKVNTSRLDNLINMVGELVIAQAMVSQNPTVQSNTTSRLFRSVNELSKITRALQELGLSMRMVSVKATFLKMARLVRDLARKANKEIVFETLGDDTELDRNMVEAIADPLVHMVRNAADHGVETPDIREKAGKPRQGRIVLSAAHEGGSVMIKLTDDGKGLDKDRIFKKAVERGLIEPGAVLSDKELFNLIFLPGFSTAEKITDVSGRGVGMDVVRTNIEALRGSVEIMSEAGVGSTFSIRLPLTLAIIDGMVIRAGTERYIVPTIAITESLRPKQKDISTIKGESEMVMLRGDLIPVCRLHRVFGINEAIDILTDGILVVVESKGRRIALLCDEILGQQQVVIKSLGNMFHQVDGVSGGAILGDGIISLILDVEGLIQTASH